MTKMIFHTPFSLNFNATSGSGVRPVKMLQAFQAIGYDVDIVSGYGKERTQSISRIKNNIKNGVRYDFCYSESSTMPTLLTEKHHCPTYPCLDFCFFGFLKKHKIPIGLFYRDIYWQFKHADNVFWIKRIIAKFFYYYDLLQYQNLIFTIFIPSNGMIEAFPQRYRSYKFNELPPGCDLPIELDLIRKQFDQLKVIYVGGVLPPAYDLKPMFQIIKECPNVPFAVICRENEWNVVCNSYMPDKLINVNIFHVHGVLLKEQYLNSTIFLVFREYDSYLNFAMPIKIFEALGYGLPVITNKGGVIGRLIEDNDIGWTFSTIDECKTLFNQIIAQPELLRVKIENVLKFRENNSWIKRAQHVRGCLMEVNKI
ncbi:MAG: glycosyltransferase family 1 protein [Candidatus Omnitrophota bacterium]